MRTLSLLLLTATLSLAQEAPGGWKPAWSDEFNGKEIDFSKWAAEENGHGGGNGELQYYVELYQTQTKWSSTGGAFPAPFDQPFHLILNLAVGGAWPGPPDASTVFPQRMTVDYVRVYQK